MELMAKQSVIIDIFPIIPPPPPPSKKKKKKKEKKKKKKIKNKLNRDWNKTGTTSHTSGLWKY